MLPVNPLLNATAPAGPHLPVALLRQYAAGTLAPAAQHRVEAHTLACTRCADILEGLLQTPPATTDQALAQLQQRLRQRAQQAAPARLTQRPRRHHWLAPQLATAAALLLALLAAGWWAWQQRQHPAPPVARVAPRPAPAPTPPAPADADNAATEVASVPPATLTRPPKIAAAAPPKRRAADAAVAAGRAVTGRSNTSSSSVNQLLTTTSVATSPDSAVKALSEVAIAPTPPVLAKAREATDRLRATMPPPPALAAAPTGGYAALREYLKKEAAEFEPETQDGPRRTGRVLVRLRIGADGKIEQAEAVRKLRADYDAEAIRLLREGPAWVPGISGGRRAAQAIDVMVEFE